MARSVVTRNATRDYVDSAALAAHLREVEGDDAVVGALGRLDALYPQDNGESVMCQLAKQFAEPLPYDFEGDAFKELRGLVPPWTSWEAALASLRDVAVEIEIARARTES